MQQGADQPRQAYQNSLVMILAAATDALAFTQGLDEAALTELAKTDRRTFRAIRDALVEMSLQVRRRRRQVCCGSSTHLAFGQRLPAPRHCHS
jgi:hypothetical protein